MQYLGNFSLKDIPNEFYVPKGTRNQGSAYWTYFEDNLLATGGTSVNSNYVGGMIRLSNIYCMVLYSK